MRKVFVAFLCIFFVGCGGTVAVKDAADIQTVNKLSSDITMPAQFPVAYYVDKSKPKKGVNFYGKLVEATDFVTKDMFANSEELSADSDPQYLLKIGANSNWRSSWRSIVTIDVVDRNGQVIYSESTETKTGLLYDPYNMVAVYNSFSSAVKELLVGFLNNQGESKLSEASLNYRSNAEPLQPLKVLVKGVMPEGSGTGFFINPQGSILTAQHVVDECLYVEVQQKGTVWDAKVEHASTLLDLAVVKIDYDNPHHALINDSAASSLGKQVFVPGFPLAGILSDYPSLTVGNVSSQGGLKGSKGVFQFTAPVQPGNSGGPIVDYQGNLLGVVSSSLNQAMILTSSGTTAQNVNFGIELPIITKFLDKNNVSYSLQTGTDNFDGASKKAVEYTNQVLCYR